MQGNPTNPADDADGDSPSFTGLTLVDDDNRPMLALAPFDASEQTPRDAAPLGSGSLGQFNQILSNVPQIATMTASRSPKLVVCDIDFDSLIAARDGGGKLGIAPKPGSSQFGQHVRLNEPTSLRSVVTTGMVFNLASTLVAQQHLAEINRKLEQIQQGIRQIHQFQQDERSSKIEAFQEEIQGCIARIAAGKSLGEPSVIALSNGLREHRAIAIHLKKDFQNALDGLRAQRASDRLGTDAIRAEMRKAIQITGTAYREYMVVTQCLVMANAILFLHGGFHEENRDAAQRYLAELDAPDGVRAQWNIYRKAVRERVDGLQPWFEFRRSTQANGRLVNMATDEVQKQLDRDIGDASRLSGMLFPRERARVLLEVKDGKCVGGRYLTA